LVKAPVVALVRRRVWSGSSASHPIALGLEFEAVRYRFRNIEAAFEMMRLPESLVSRIEG
jgi:hypothetical protein